MLQQTNCVRFAKRRVIHSTLKLGELTALAPWSITHAFVGLSCQTVAFKSSSTDAVRPCSGQNEKSEILADKPSVSVSAQIAGHITNHPTQLLPPPCLVRAASGC